jgi:BirA family transcriptional regulator, biotin operon repressor / biotin---[acetyl-CoA-carboxylase] ligase
MAEMIGKRIIKLEHVDSTNNYTSKLAANNNTDEGTVVCTSFQTDGRGQVKNSWESQPYKNILISILFRPTFLPVHHQFLLSKVVALGVTDLLSLFVEGVKVKWPNDIYVGDRKIAGILIENSIMGYTIGSSVAGIGININQAEFLSDAPNPISLYQLLKSELDLDELISLLCKLIDAWYAKLKQGEIDAVNQAYLNALYRFGEESIYSDIDGKFRGTITGVNEIGQLQISLIEGKIRTYHFKEVTFL